MQFFDTHAHYNDEKYSDNLEEIIKKIYSYNVTKCIVAGADVNSSIKAVEIANRYDFLYAICGVHPSEITNIEEDIIKIEKIAKNHKVVAIGEIGLDYYWDKENKENQKYAFIKQINLANKLKLPIVIHSRDAIEDTINIVKEHTPVEKGIFHCCQANSYLIKEALKLGFYISFAGPITFKNSKNAETVIKEVPLDRLLIETDSPYLSPEPYRGQINDSTKLYLIAEKIAKVKEMKIEEIAKITYENGKKIFKIE